MTFDGEVRDGGTVESPGASFVHDGEPAMDAPWGLRGAIAVPVISFGAQILLSFVLTGLAFFFLSVLDPGLIEDREDLLEISVLVSIAPLALFSSLVTVGLIYGSVSLICGKPLLRSLWLKRPTITGTLSSTLLGISVAV